MPTALVYGRPGCDRLAAMWLEVVELGWVKLDWTAVDIEMRRTLR
ncbi:hypothetical protein [Deinococcus frigens]|nr:hypothetical protein [Deinococcus frigens]